MTPVIQPCGYIVEHDDGQFHSYYEAKYLDVAHRVHTNAKFERPIKPVYDAPPHFELLAAMVSEHDAGCAAACKARREGPNRGLCEDYARMKRRNCPDCPLDFMIGDPTCPMCNGARIVPIGEWADSKPCPRCC